MKRAPRVLILGPTFVIAAPIMGLMCWLLNDDPRYLWSEMIDSMWNGL